MGTSQEYEARSDTELLSLWCEGDRRAGNALTRRHYEPLFTAGAVACPRSASGVASTTTAGPPPHAAVPVPVTFASAPASSFTSLPTGMSARQAAPVLNFGTWPS